MTVLDTFRDLQVRDEATARVLLELSLYEALCDEVDRVRPQLEYDVAKALGEKAAQGLVALARQPISKASIELADQLVDLVEVAKRDGDWDAREHPRDDDNGRFVPKNGKVRQFIANALGIATSKQPDSDMAAQTKDALGTWVGPQSDKYSRMRSMGQGLLATNDPHARPAGTVMRLIGDIGPEAQKVLEPGIRRTAYRYRGTERRPDPLAQRQIAEMVSHFQGPGQDHERLDRLSDAGAAMLIPDIPNKDTAAISLAAGKMPPSLGVMFDGRGRLVSEAQGYNGDHYLPFDLSNLKRLKGGSYVRTRTTGGPTDEDIYTALMTGARHLTVVSNSGVFTLEFRPDLRGGRRYSDKARQMVDRYGRLVNAIGSGELYQNPMPQDQVKTIREASLKAAGGNAEQAKVIFARRLREAQEAASFLGQDEDELMAEAERRVRSGPPGRGTYQSQVRDTFNELRADQDRTTARKYRLDGKGYAAALRALKTEFPYYVRFATYTPLQEYGTSHKLHGFEPGSPRRPRGGADMGYTEPGGLTPKNAGIPDPKDTEHTGRRILLGDTKRRTVEGTGEPKKDNATQGGAPAAGGGQTAPTGGNGKATGSVDEQLKSARQAELNTLYNAAGKSVMARTKVGGEWIEPLPDADGQGTPHTMDAALGWNGETFAKWYVAQPKYGNDWAKAMQGLTQETNPRVLDKWVEASNDIEDELKRTNTAGYPPEAFEAFRDSVKRLRLLAQPFKEGPVDLHAEPEISQSDPQAVPEVLAIGLDEDKIKEWPQLEGNEQAGAFAAQWQAEGTTDSQIRTQIAQVAGRIKMLKDVAAGRPVRGMDANDPDIQAEAKDLVDQGDGAPDMVKLADMHRGWALHRLAKVSGATRGTGAAVPFARPALEGSKEDTAKRHSTPSRLLVHRPGSPVAKALHQALAPRVPPLHRVRL